MENLNDYLFNADGSMKTAEELVQASDDDSVQVFMKIAEAAGEDVSVLNGEEMTARYVEVMSKVAEECASSEKKDEEKEEKKAAIAAELNERAKVAEAQAAGVQMGQAAWSVIQAGLQEYFAGGGTGKVASGPPATQRMIKKTLFGQAADKVRSAYGSAKEKAKAVGETVSSAAGHTRDFAKAHKGKLIGGAATVAAGGAGYAGYKHMSKDKTASIGAEVLGPLDDAAVESALEKAAAAGYDPDAVADLIIAAGQQGLFSGGASKVASTMTPDLAVHVRAHEILETVGFEINWDKV